MQYNSFVFLGLFFVLVLLAYYIAPLKARWCVLLGASIVYYLISGHWLIVIVAGTALVVYGAARRIDRISTEAKAKRKQLPKEERKAFKQQVARKKKHVLAAACIFCIGLLLFLKYFNFVGGNINHIFETVGWAGRIPFLKLFLPLGISFYSMSAVSYLADVYWEKYPAEKNYLKMLLFLTFFPVVVEGPISRFDQLGHQLFEGHRFDYQKFTYGAQRIIWGLFKKVVIADRLNMFVSVIFNGSENYGGAAVFFAIIGYTVQLYTDFSGCIDIAAGCAQMLGIDLASNFEQPFFSRNVNEFWRRWHITLGAWLRDYIFYPISLSKFFQKISKGARKHMNEYYAQTIPPMVALFAVWFICGLWHGAEWKYIVYGLYYYAIMVVGMLAEPLFHKVCTALHINRSGKGFGVFQLIRTLVFVNIGMLIFNAKTLTVAGSMFVSLFEPAKWTSFAFVKDVALNNYDYVLLILCTALVLIVDICKEKGICMRDRIATMHFPARTAIYIGAIVCVAIFGAYGPGYGAVDFIYAQF